MLYIGDIIKAYDLDMHFYADDGQIYSSCAPHVADHLQSRVIDCILNIKAWMASNRLMLNPSKTEFLWLSTPRLKHLISRAPFKVDGVDIVPKSVIRLLGVLVDEVLSFDKHIGCLTRNCYYQLRRIRSIRRYIPTSVAIQLVRALVLPRIDYCNSVLLGLPSSQ